MGRLTRSSLGCRTAIEVVESAYRLDGDDRDWLARVARAASPELNRGAGVIAYIADAETMVSREAAGADVASELAAAMRKLNDGAPVEVLADLRAAPRGFYSIQREYRGYRSLIDHWAAELTPRGIADAIGVCSPAGPETVMMFAPCRQVENVPPRVKAMWSQIGIHIAAGYRLRRWLRSSDVERLAEAIVGVDGDVKHAIGGAEALGARSALRDAVRAIERARGPLRGEDPAAALDLWAGLVQGRWSLVDYWDHDGRRFFAAHPNAPGVLDPRRLRRREASALALTIDGASLKEIAYSLGIGAGNARALVSTALRKLGVESRATLYRIAIDQGGVIELTLDDDTKIHVLASAAKRSRLPVAEVLSAAELEVAKLAAAGHTNAAIASRRSSSERTVANQMAAVLRKLGLRSRVELSAHLPLHTPAHVSEARP